MKCIHIIERGKNVGLQCKHTAKEETGLCQYHQNTIPLDRCNYIFRSGDRCTKNTKNKFCCDHLPK